MGKADTRTAYEQERDKRVEENKRKMQELGIAEAAAVLEEPKPAVKRQKREKKPTAEELGDALERRVSSRERNVVNYSEVEARIARGGEPRAPVDYTERIQGITLDQDKAEQLRCELEAKRKDKDAKAAASGKARGPVDSGKGVRIQGGRVYDSKHGVTCHWCRQKTLEDHVTCTNDACGNGRRMPLSFCAKCLRNRHGEDFEAAEASGSWWCPSCRGSCGPGCVICCNCGPCRKKAGLEPTHQVVKLARDAGFGNVHDYLVHLVTGESGEEIAARKLTKRWGAWLKGEGGSEASEQTGGAGCSAHQHEGDGEQQLAADEDAAATKDQRTQGGRGKKGGRGKAAAAAAAGGRGKQAGGSTAKKAGGRRGKKAAAAEEDEEQQQQQDAADKAPAAGASDGEEEEEDIDLPLLSSQDNKLSRKQRIMQSLGLAPVTVCE